MLEGAFKIEQRSASRHSSLALKLLINLSSKRHLEEAASDSDLSYFR